MTDENEYASHHCAACGLSDGWPVVTDADDNGSCCTCCSDSDGNHGPGLQDGRGW